MATLGIFEPVPQRERNAIPAGSFEDRPWLDRVNPFTPIHSKRFVPTPQAQKIIRRPMHEKNHPGQIALPGGAMEENETLEKTALREAFEEVGIVPDNVEIIGKMTPLPVPVSKYVITPFIGVTENEPKWNINEQEVDELIILKFKDLIDSNN